MASYYTVVRYVPDPIADERINFGVIVYGEGAIRSRFIERWTRVRGFGGEDVSFLQDFSTWLSAQQLSYLENRIDESIIKTIAGRWKNSIQLSEPRGSLKSPDDLLSEVSRRFLREPIYTKRQSGTKRKAVSLAFHSVKAALKERFGSTHRELLKRRYPISGKYTKHPFDLVVANGHPFFAAEGLSFDATDTNELPRDVEATAWVIENVRAKHPELPLAVIALKPDTDMTAFKTASRIFQDLNTSLITEDSVDVWAGKMADKVSLNR